MFRPRFTPSRLVDAIRAFSPRLSLDEFGHKRFIVLEDNQLLVEFVFNSDGCMIYASIGVYPSRVASLVSYLVSRYSRIEVSEDPVCFDGRGMPIYGDKAILYYEDLAERIVH